MPKREITGETIEGLDGLEVHEFGKSYPATIVRLLKTTAGAVFQDRDGNFAGKARDGETEEEAMSRPMLLVSYEGRGFAGEIPMNIPEVVRPNSKLGAFVARYGSLPAKGMTVSVRLVKDGDYTRAELDI